MGSIAFHPCYEKNRNNQELRVDARNALALDTLELNALLAQEGPTRCFCF
jgi:hypothetical protein